MENNRKIFLRFFLSITGLLILVLTAIYFIIKSFDEKSFKTLFYIINAVLAAIVILFIFSGILTILIYKGKGSKKIPYAVYRFVSSFFFPLILYMSNITGYEKILIKRVFVRVNNNWFEYHNIKYPPDKVLLLLPHCIQYSKCDRRLYQDVDNCTGCGKCNVAMIKEFKSVYGIHVRIATGGTSARNFVKKLKPKVIIASACERDLVSGILDVKRIPVYGVINDRPNGPCVNTYVDITDLEKILDKIVK